MITKTAGEILHGAQVKAQVYNVDFLDFHTVTNELNNAYRQLYTEIAESDSDYFIKSAIFNDANFELPSDCFIIKTVAFVNTDKSWTKINQQPSKEFVHGCYYIQNGVFHYNGTPNRPILLRYVPTPLTVTAPRESEDIDVDPSIITEYGRMTEKGFFYKTEDDYCYYSFDSKESEVIDESEYRKQTSKYMKNNVTVDYENQTVTMNNGDDEWDVTEYFSNEAFGDFVNIVFDTPYAMVSYEDGHIMVMNGFERTMWNIKAATGHETLGEIKGLRTNDKTLWGCIYLDADDGLLYRASFVPDTVMNYPSNALFNYLEVLMAQLFLSMNNIDNQYINQQLYATVKNQFYKELNAYRSSVSDIQNELVRRPHV
jgi:hypothetical protein